MHNYPKIKICCTTPLHDLTITVDEPIAIIDSGCDQCIININMSLTHSFTGEHYSVGGTLFNMKSSNL